MASITLLNLRTQARQRANMERSQFVSDAEFNNYINLSGAELHDILIQKFGNDYYANTFDITLSNQPSYSLPNDFYKVLGVDLVLDSIYSVALKKFEFADRNLKNYYYVSDHDTLPQYKVTGDAIYFIPQNNHSGKTVKFWYIPVYTKLLADGDVLKGFNGWEDYIIVDAAIKALIKEESDTSELFRIKNDLLRRIEAASDHRDSAHPNKMVSTYDKGWFI